MLNVLIAPPPEPETLSPGTCMTRSVALVIPSRDICSPLNATSEMATFCIDSSRFCAVTMISSIAEVVSWAIAVPPPSGDAAARVAATAVASADRSA
jgi:hypothetical protein